MCYNIDAKENKSKVGQKHSVQSKDNETVIFFRGSRKQRKILRHSPEKLNEIFLKGRDWVQCATLVCQKQMKGCDTVVGRLTKMLTRHGSGEKNRLTGN